MKLKVNRREFFKELTKFSLSAGFVTYIFKNNAFAQFIPFGFWKKRGSVLSASTGGTITTYGAYRVHTFTTSGTFTASGSGTVDYLIVAGGGGGGSSGANYCGGGGAGGMLVGSKAVTAQGYTITIGAGGAPTANGSNSVALGVTAIGGGAGASGYYGAGGAGGSGGGGGPTNGPGGAGTAGQGNNGGIASSANVGGSDSGGGGGGGAGGIGDDQSVALFRNNPGLGGVGLQDSLQTGVAQWYAAGGTGSGWYAGTNTNGIGGSVYGGISAAGLPNTGSGGGGGRSGSGGAGGSGIVIIRYLV